MRAFLVSLLLWCNFSWAQESKSNNSPQYDLAFKIEEKSAAVDINLEYTPEGLPSGYSSFLETNVCSDGLCKPVSITIAWDLLGNFRSYHTDDEHPLTKFDHVNLTEADHKQLHTILSDTTSIIRDYQVEDMIDTTTRIKSLVEVDAVTGATSKAFEGATVEGALYTVYTLWHFINGDVRKKILEHTRAHLSDPLIREMLHSRNRDYVGFIFKNLTALQKKKFLPDIISLVPDRDLYIPHFAIAQLAAGDLEDQTILNTLLNFLPKVNVHVQNALLERFKELKMNDKNLSILLIALPGFNESQVVKAFSILENNKRFISADVLNQLHALLNYPDPKLSRRIADLLHKIEENTP